MTDSNFSPTHDGRSEDPGWNVNEENIPEEQINNVNEPDSVCNINRGHLVLKEEGNIKYEAGDYGEALLLYKEAISDLKSQLTTFPCTELAGLFGNMSACHMQLDDIEQSYKTAVTCVRYDPTCYMAHSWLGQIFARKCDYEKACLEYIYSLDLYTNIDSYVIKTIWPVIEIVKELCILHMDEAKTHKCPAKFDKLLKIRVTFNIWAYVLYDFIMEKNFPAVTYALKKSSDFNVCIGKLGFDLHPLCDLNLLKHYPDISDFINRLLMFDCDYTTLSTHTGDKYIHAAVKITFATRNLIFLKCVCTIVLRNDDQDLLDSDCNTALHIATLENTYDKLKLNVIQELIGIRCSPHKKNSQNKLAIDNLIKDTKSKKCLQKYMDETEDQVKHHETVTISSTRKPPANSVSVEKQQNAMRKLDNQENYTSEDKCNTCMETFTRCQQNIGTNSIDSLKELSKLIKSKHPSTKHKDIIAKALSLITTHLAKSPDTGIPEEVLKISQKYLKKIIDDLLKGKKWLQMYKLLIEHAKVHNGDWFPGCTPDIQIEMVIRCLKDENPTISPHTLSDVVYVFLKNGGTLLHVEDDSKRYVEMVVKGNHYKLLELIICSHNVDPQYLSLFGEIPIHAALHISLYKDTGNFSIFNKCMEKYQKNPQKYPMLDPQQQDTDGNTLFHLVVKDDCNDTLLKAAKKLQEWHVRCKVSNLHGKFPHDYLKINDPRWKVLKLAMKYDNKIKQEATVNITEKEISNVQIQPCVTVKTEVKQKPVALTTSHEKEPIKTCLSKQSDQTDKSNDDTSEETNVKESLLSQIERKIRCLKSVHKFGEDEGPTEEHIQKVTGGNSQTFNTDTSNADGTQIEDELEIGRDLLEGNVWEVECTSDVWNTLRRSNRLTPLIKREIIHIIEDLASGECTKDMHRKLETQNEKINLFESNITDGSRLIWEECIEFSSQLTKKYISPKKRVNIYSQRIRIWDIVLEHEKIKNSVSRIEKSHKKGASCLIQKKLKFHEKMSNNTDYRLPELYVEYMDHNEESVEDISYYPPTSPQDSEYSIVKFYTFSSILANNILKPIEMKVDFPFRVTELEYEITTLPLSAPIILIGRSGTGKTTCCLYRLWDTFQNYWTNADCDDDKCSTDVVHNNLTNADCDDDECSTNVVHNNLTNADYDDDKCSPEAVHNNLTNADCNDKCSPEAVHNNITNADCDDDKCSLEAVHNNFTYVDSDEHKCSPEAVHNNITNADYDDYKCSTEAVQNNFTHVDSDDHKYSPEAVHNNITNADYVDDKCSPETEPLLDDGTTNYIVTKVLLKPKLPPRGKAVEPQKKKYSSFGIGNHGVILQTQDRDRKMLLKNCRKYGLEFRRDTPRDGNCFFHAICDQFERLYLPRMSAKDLRTSVVGYMKEHRNYEGSDGHVSLEDFTSEPYEKFCERMSDDGEYADHVVVESTAKMLNRDIVVITSSHENKQIQIKGSNKPDDDETPLLVGHIPEIHYQSLQPKVGSVTNDAEENTTQQTCLPDYQCVSSIPESSDITTSITNSYPQIMKDASVENIDTPQCRTEPTSKDLNNSTEREHHLHQIFITKNRVLCGEVQKTFREFMHADENTVRHIEWENKDLPNRLQDINDYQYPLFITDRQLLLMLDASLEPPYYFDRNIDFSPKVEVEGWTNLDILQNILSLHDDLDSDYSTESESSENDEDHEVDDHRTQRKVKRTRAKKIDPRREVTYEVFKELIWPRIINKSVASKDTKKYNPSLVWTEILSFIKGSYEAISSENGYLDIEEYKEVGNKKAPTFRDVREHIYTIFMEYERLKKRKQKHNWFFDQTDFVRNIYQRLSKQNEKKWSIDQIYVDEAQDFTQAELYLLIQLCDCPSGMFLTGDTAQSIMKGISFRFKDLQSLFLHVSKNKSCKPPSGISWVPDEVKSLSHNYRSHAGITSLATSVLHILIKLFPESVDKLEKDKGLFPGPKPVILESRRTSDLNRVLCNNKRETSRIEFGAHQAILVVDENARKGIPEELKGALVLTLYEAKGLEFDDVLLYNLFKDSQDSVEWRVVTSFVNSDCNEEETLQPSVRLRHSQFDKKRDRVVEFDEKRDRVLIAELKQLYTAITRARCNVWIFDESEVKREPMFDYFKAHDLVVTEVERSFATKSTPQEWIERGEDLMKRELYERAAACFKTAGDDNREKIAYAYQHYQNARQKRLGSTEMNEELYQAANKFLDVKMNKEAAKCLGNAGQLDLATLIYEKGAQRKKLAEIYRKQKKPVKSCQQYEHLNRYDKAIDVLLENKMFDKAIDVLRRYKKKVQDKKEERGTDYDRPKLYHPRDNQSEEQINGSAAEYYHARGERNLMLETLSKIPVISYRVSFLRMRDNGAKNNYIELAAKILSENGLKNEAAELYLQYGRTIEALALFRQIGDAYLIAHCLLIHARTKLHIDADGSARYISNEKEKVEIYLVEAIQLFKKSNRHDNAQGDLNTAMGEANLLLGRLNGDQDYIGFAFGKFEKRKPHRNEAGQLECLNWMINHSRLEKVMNLRKVIFGMENMFNVFSILVTSQYDLAKRNRMEQILQNFGLHLEMNVVSYNPRHNPSILKLLGKEEYPAISTKQDVRGEISIESACHAIIAYLLLKGQQWHHQIMTVLEKETTCLHKSDISQIAAKDLFRLIQLDVLYGRLEYFLDEGIQSVKGHLKKEERQVIDTYKHKMSSFSQCRLLIDDALCVIPHLRDNTKLIMDLYFARGFIDKYFKYKLSKLMNRSNKMRYQSIAYFVELITCHRIFALKNDINADLAKLENTIRREYLKGETSRNDIRRMGFSLQRGGKEGVIFLSQVRPFLYSIRELTKFNGIFGALKEFKRFVCFMKGHEIQLTFSETTLLLHWIQYYIYVGFSLQSKCSNLRQIELEFIIPSTFLLSVKLVDSLIFCNSDFSTGIMIANFTSKTIPKYVEISGIVEGCIEYLVGNIMKTAFKHLLECIPINETKTLLDITNEVETVMCLCMVFIINLGKIILKKTETQILREIALINIPEDSPEKIVWLMKGIKSASGIADIYNHLLEVLNSKGEKPLKFKWDAKQKKIAECHFISDLKNGFHLPDSIKTLSDPEKIPEQIIDESESEKVEFTADEIKSTEEDHEKIAQVVENTEQSHAANVELIHEKAHSDESLKDIFFPECLVNESRCDICGKTFQPVDLAEDDGSEYLSDSEQHDTLSLPRSALAPVRSLSSTSDEIKLSKDFEEHISSRLHKSNKEKYDRFKKYYNEKVKSGLEEVDQFIQVYQLDSPNVTKIYGNDDYRINAFVTSFKECKTRMVQLVKARQWTDRNTEGAIHELTKQMGKLNASVKDAFHTHTQPENVETEDQIEDMRYDPNKKRKKSKLKGKQKWRKYETPTIHDTDTS